MRGIIALVLAAMLVTGTAHAAEAEKKALPPPPAAKAPPASPKPAAGESEAAKRWKSIKAQEEWVARLNKQIKGEANQLSEMRLALADAFKLDPKKLEAGLYDHDEKTDTFVEKKPA
jgi:hypothetical protein